MTGGGPVCWPVSRWPEADRRVWERARGSYDPFSDEAEDLPAPVLCVRLREPSWEGLRKNYGRWLSFLGSRGWLDPMEPPLRRATRKRLRAYFRELHDGGNAPKTIDLRFRGLGRVLGLLAPGARVAHIVRPFGCTVRSMLPRVRKQILVPDDVVATDWALSLMDDARSAATPAQCLQYRDGLLLAMLATRARRLRSMALLRVGRELVWREGRYWLDLAPEQVKTNKPDRIHLPDLLTVYVKHYLEVVRPRLLGGQTHDALWVTNQGGPWTANAIEHRVYKRTKARFGHKIGPHRFRNALATGSVLRDPDHPGVAAAVLGISREIVQEHYNLAGQITAVNKLSELINNRKKQLGIY